MTRGSKFGRRGGRAPAVATARSRRSATPETEAEEGPDDPISTAVRFSAATIALMVAAMVGVWFTMPTLFTLVAFESSRAPGGASPNRAASPVAADDAETIRPEAGPEETRQQIRAEALGAKPSISDQKRTAALTFFGFYHLNTRVRSTYCAALGVDMAGFNTKFQQTQRSAYVRATEIVRAAGLTEDKIFADSRAELSGLIDKDMRSLGEKTGLGPTGGCQAMVQFTDTLLPSIDFAKLMPDAHRTLMGS